MRRLESTPLPKNVGALLRSRAETVPDTVALDFFDLGQRLTYRDLEQRVMRLAHGLKSVGIRHGTHVGLMVHNAPAYPISWLALATLGSVTIPVNDAYTSREVMHVLDDADAEFLIADADFLDVLRERELRVPPERTILIGARQGYLDWDQLASTPTSSALTDEPELEDLLNIQFTSGTTGLPKGAMLTHRSLLTHGRVGSAMICDLARNILIANPFHYITGEWQFLMAMFQSGTAYFPRRQSASHFMEWVRMYGIHFCNFPEIVTLAPPSPEDRDNDLKAIYCYSHQPAQYRRHEERYGCPAREGYSMTEIGITLYIPLEAEGRTGGGCVGIPAAFREVCVKDTSGETVPDGELGEICVRGPGVSVGYYKRSSVGVFHPGGWFRTGDLGRRSAEGWFWYLGRLKDMVKRSGENVSATEVEAVLRGVEGVAEAAVVPVPDPVRGEEVKAYLLLRPGLTANDVTPEAVRQHCAANLARFKIPRYLEYVTEFPRTPGLKIRKSVLRSAKPDLRVGSFDVVRNTWV